MAQSPEFQIAGGNVTFWLRVKPRSRREALSVDSSGELRLEVSAPPLEGRANQACARFLARALRLPEACVSILRGRQSRRKLVRVTGRTPEETVAALKALAAGKSTARKR
jgi:uncharacterized protein